MEKLRRPRMNKKCLALAVTACFFGLAVEAAHAGRHLEAVNMTLSTYGPPGMLVIANHGDAEIQLMSAIQIEQKAGDQWRPIDAEFKMVADCADAAKVTKCVRLGSGASIIVVRWTGFSCSGQCNQSCRANTKCPPGTYRFVVTSCADNATYPSDPFVLPAPRTR